jgi:hypothetical protein
MNGPRGEWARRRNGERAKGRSGDAANGRWYGENLGAHIGRHLSGPIAPDLSRACALLRVDIVAGHRTFDTFPGWQFLGTAQIRRGKALRRNHP